MMPSIVNSEPRKSMMICQYGKVIFGNVIPFTSPQYKFPKLWILREVSNYSNDLNGDFEPADFNETGVSYYQNYHTDDLVIESFAKSRIHESLGESGKKWRYFHVLLDRLSGKISVEIKVLTTLNSEGRRSTDNDPVIDSFEGVCEKVDKRI